VQIQIAPGVTLNVPAQNGNGNPVQVWACDNGGNVFAEPNVQIQAEVLGYCFWQGQQGHTPDGRPVGGASCPVTPFPMPGVAGAGPVSDWILYVEATGDQTVAAYFTSQSDAQSFQAVRLGVWAVDGNGGVFAETNKQLIAQVLEYAYTFDESVSVNEPYRNGDSSNNAIGGVKSPIALAPGAQDWNAYVANTGNKSMVAYFTSEADAIAFLHGGGFQGSISFSNAIDLAVTGLSQIADQIGNDFSQGNFGGGIEGVLGLILDTTVVGAASGASTSLLNGAGADNTPASAYFQKTVQSSATVVNAIGQGAQNPSALPKVFTQLAGQAPPEATVPPIKGAGGVVPLPTATPAPSSPAPSAAAPSSSAGKTGSSTSSPAIIAALLALAALAVVALAGCTINRLVLLEANGDGDAGGCEVHQTVQLGSLHLDFAPKDGGR
jgi:hypothetical protein